MTQEPSPAASSGPADRLDSWKEVAAYLKRDVTTAQRWERREGLPIHRQLHEKLARHREVPSRSFTPSLRHGSPTMIVVLGRLATCLKKRKMCSG